MVHNSESSCQNWTFEWKHRRKVINCVDYRILLFSLLIWMFFLFCTILCKLYICIRWENAHTKNLLHEFETHIVKVLIVGFLFFYLSNTNKKTKQKKVLDYRRRLHRHFPAMIRKAIKVPSIRIHRCHRMYSSNYCKINRSRHQLAPTIVVHRPCNKIVIQIQATVAPATAAMSTATMLQHHHQHRRAVTMVPVQDSQFTHHWSVVNR